MYNQIGGTLKLISSEKIEMRQNMKLWDYKKKLAKVAKMGVDKREFEPLSPQDIDKMHPIFQ